MSTYYGMKPIVGDGLQSFIHGFNRNGYDESDTWSGINQTVVLIVSNSLANKNRQKITFGTNGTDQDITSIDDESWNAMSGSYSIEFWIKPYHEELIFEKGNMFNLYQTGTGHLIAYMKAMDVGLSQGITVTGSNGWCTHQVSNNHSSLSNFDPITMRWKWLKYQYTNNWQFLWSYNTSMCSDSASFFMAQLGEIDKLPQNGWTTTVGSYEINKSYTTVGDPANYIAFCRGIDTDDNYVFASNYINFNGYNGWLCKYEKATNTLETASYYQNTYGICIDKYPSTGSFGYATSLTSKICKFTQSTMNIILETGSAGIGEHQFSAPWGIKCDNDYLYVGDAGNNRIMKMRKSDLSYVASTGSTTPGDYYYLNPTDMSVSGDYLYFPSDYTIVKMNKNTLEIEKKLPFGAVLSDYIQYGFRSTFEKNGYLFSCNRGASFKVFKMDEYGNLTIVWNYTMTGQSGQADVYGIFLDEGIVNSEPTGHMWVCDGDGDCITKWKLNSNYTMTFLTRSGVYNAQNSDPLNWYNPREILVDGDYAYGVDLSNHRIKKLKASDLNWVAMTGSQGSGEHQFEAPYGATISGSYLFIADEGNNRIQKFTKDLEFVETVNTNGNIYKVTYDEATNTFYGTQFYRQIFRWDNNWNQIGYKAFAQGENFGYGYVPYNNQLSVGEKFVHTPDVWQSHMLDKETLSYENTRDGHRHVLRGKTVDSGSWNQVSFTFSDTNVKMYINGEYQTSSSYSTTAGATTIFQSMRPMRFGKYGGENDARLSDIYYPTEVGAVLIYNKVLNDQEVRQNYDAIKWEFTD